MVVVAGMLLADENGLADIAVVRMPAGRDRRVGLGRILHPVDSTVAGQDQFTQHVDRHRPGVRVRRAVIVRTVVGD